MIDEQSPPRLEPNQNTQQATLTLYDNVVKEKVPSTVDLEKFAELPRGMLFLEVVVEGIKRSDRDMLTWGLIQTKGKN